jgi:hypothetical protein
MSPDSLEATRLWRKLDTGFDGQEGKDARKLAQYLLDVCQEAQDRMRSFPSLHPQYTLHDEVHLLRVTELMAVVIPQETLDLLNPVEIAMLILAAHFHDQGMVLEREELDEIRSGTNPEFEVFRQNWEAAHPNLREVRQRLRDDVLSAERRELLLRSERELQDALFTDYVRRTHGARSARFVHERYGDDGRMKAAGTSLAPLMAKLCRSHAKPASLLSPDNGFHYDELVGTYPVNMPYLGLVLRLADILDFDRDRTPDSLYRTISFTSEVSLVEWGKHRSVEGWRIGPSVIQYVVECEHPAYERAVREFMGWIDNELGAAQSLVRRFPRETPEYYRFDLPTRVDRERIGPKDGAYIYHDLEFSLSRDEVVKLFMTENLYRSPSLCVRELLQNGLDALRHRRALFKRDRNIDWQDGKVLFEHVIDGARREVLRCTDDGAGMDEDIIRRFLTRVGRSYYRSPEFAQERASFAEVGADFDPASRFGIGFMSCFMLGDDITIRTRRDLGPRVGEGRPLVVEVNGLGGLLTIREGPPDQPVGTTVEIVVRERPPFYSPNTDQVKLVQTVYGFALACEFEVEARCNIPGIEGEEKIPPGPYVKETEMEAAGITRSRVFEQEFSEIDRRLGGRVRVGFLVDGSGKPTTANDEAYWVHDDRYFSRYGVRLRDGVEKAQRRLEAVSSYDLEGHTSLDGILVCGPLRRRKKGGPLQEYTQNLTRLGRAYFALDVRGEIKPPLTAARRPAAGENNTVHPEWLRIIELANLAHGRVWEQVAEKLHEPQDGDTFWQLANLYDPVLYYSIPWMRAGRIWSSVSVPILRPDGEHEWRKVSSLGHVVRRPSEDGWSSRLLTPDGGCVAAPESVADWSREEGIIIDEHGNERRGLTSDWDDGPVHAVVLSMSTLVLEGGVVRAELREPGEPDRAPWESHFQFELGDPSSGVTYVLPYAGELRSMLCANSFVTSVNREHPLVREALRAQYKVEKSEVESFAEAAVEHFSRSPLESLVEGWPIDRDPMRYLGNLYLLAEREGIPPEMLPPYRLWSPRLGVVEIGEEQLQRWAAAEWA